MLVPVLGHPVDWVVVRIVRDELLSVVAAVSHLDIDFLGVSVHRKDAVGADTDDCVDWSVVNAASHASSDAGVDKGAVVSLEAVGAGHVGVRRRHMLWAERGAREEGGEIVGAGDKEWAALVLLGKELLSFVGDGVGPDLEDCVLLVVEKRCTGSGMDAEGGPVVDEES